MPYKSEAQRGLFHSPNRPAGISDADVEEFDRASEGMRLPERVPKQPKVKKKTTGHKTSRIRAVGTVQRQGRKKSGRSVSRRRR